MENNREEVNPRRKLRIGTMGNAGSQAAIKVMVETIEGIVGARSLVEVNAELEARGGMAEIPDPDYGYARGSLLLHERIDYDLCNGWVKGDLYELTYAGRHGGYDHWVGFIADCNLARVDITRGIHEE